MLRSLAKGAAWMVAFRFAERSLGLVSTIVLARLLVPADFGLVAMAMSFVGLVELIGAFGFDNALIQRRVLERRHYDTAFTLNVLLGILCGALIAATAPLAATFYEEPRLLAVMLLLAGASAVQGFENVGTADFRRGMQFHREFMFLGAKRVLAFAITMVAAVALRSYWALIIGIVAGRVAGVVLSYAAHPFRPRFDLKARRDLMSFSSWLLATNVLTFVSQRFSHFVLGRIGGSRALGLYTMAYEIATLPTSELLAPINRAVFPAFSRVADDRAELRRGYLAMVGIATLLTMPAAFGIAAVAEPLVLVALSDKWADAVPLIEILAFLGAAGALINCTTPAYMAIGRPHIATFLLAGRLVLTVPALLLAGRHFGYVGIAWVELVSLALAVPLSMTIVSRVIGVGIADNLARSYRPIIASVGMFAIVRWYVDHAAERGLPIDGVAMLASSVLLGAASYVALVWTLWTFAGRVEGTESELLRVLRSKLQSQPA